MRKAYPSRRVWRLLAILLPLVLAREALAQASPAGTAGTYFLLGESRFEVKTGKSGLLGFAGHDHIIRANAFDGTVQYNPDDPAATTINIRVLTDGLEVLTPPDTAEIRKVTASMRNEVMHVAEYPEITFVATSVTPAAGGYRVMAELTMHGTTREVPVDVKVEFRGDTLVARAGFEVKQTDFGIKPFRGGPAGTVRVADKVSFRIEARALRTTE